ncbi:efflux RND transporter periplasmic adaptor subunit [Streptomyces sp. 8K308]|uniref:peptidoglycan-binding protein n=1 Tax=Streptomyces sp. 8K308 TaxID=2530388 RepID=UPI001044762B|nr:peptidoglycan-binding protein [Streptomyces sp. 8K308]TDC19503.1 efflux RND transporter periplasmic adaptor subunit [Streptomyces sp. 8K308]
MSRVPPTDATDATDATATPDEERPGRRRRSRLGGLALGALVLAAAGAGTGYWLVGQDASADQGDAAAGPTATAEVSRETLAVTRSFGGTLGHGEPHTVSATGRGTVTALAEADAEIERGTELYRVDEELVTALLGSLPMFRDLRVGDAGTDVEQLEDNLTRLGYDGFTVDEEFTSATEDAVRAWQEDVGAAETGFVPVSSVVFLAAGSRVDSLHVDVGAQVSPGAPVLDVTGSDQMVSLEAGMEDRELLAVDTEVTVELPDGRAIPGTVTASDVVPAATGSGAGGAAAAEEAAGADDAVAEVEVRLSEPVDQSLLGTPLDVVIEVDERENVLAVPVSALLALSAGAYGLEVVAADGTTEVVEVETGLFADGRVEVSGGGVTEGTVVGVAGR